MEFEEKDYEGARNCANQIKAKAIAIMTIFTEIDETMNRLYGSDWASSGAENARDRYNRIRQSYEKFHNKVIDMHKHILAVTNRNQEADAAASQAVTNVIPEYIK